MSQLPPAVHLVAKAPETDPIGISAGVAGAAVAFARADWAVAVLHQRPRLVGPAAAEVDRHHRCPSHSLRQRHELVGSEHVRLAARPGPVEPARPQLARTDAVAPVVARNEVAARIAHGGEAQCGECVENVGAKTLRVGVAAGRVEDAFINGPPHVLEEAAEDARIDGCDRVVCAETQSGRGQIHGALRGTVLHRAGRRRPRPPRRQLREQTLPGIGSGHSLIRKMFPDSHHTASHAQPSGFLRRSTMRYQRHGGSP